ncbi:hypothetical protein COV17_03840 [Candidatus Woesearchaeota archaeon CG10_big_fil_rev_8_21_14_0_10_36_11]|nr:MAG: hypothetical protein COV17_03840 [Candidatus Woesearchaeota archaeon CG10_big_fil_rev_8_21_14_0_10_36_11]
MDLIDGAVEHVAMVNDIIPIVAYITARPTGVISGTTFWLRKHGFPEAPVIARPPEVNKYSSDWKAGILVRVYPFVVGIIDDHPKLVQYLPANYQRTLFLITHDHHPRDDIKIVCGIDWLTMYDKIRGNGIKP